MTRATFLDRDGVLNHAVMHGGRPRAPWRFEEFAIAKDARAAVDRLKASGFKVIVFTNQPDVARGDLDPTVLKMINDSIVKELGVDELYTCAHDDHHMCYCRKPKPGMLIDAASAHGISLARSFVVGDGWKDIEAGRRAGCNTILIQRPYNTGDDAKADMIAKDLGEAVDFILGGPQ